MSYNGNVNAPKKNSRKKGRPHNEEEADHFDVSCEPKLVAYLEDLVKLQGFGNSKSAVARNFIWQEVNRLIEVRRLKER